MERSSANAKASVTERFAYLHFLFDVSAQLVQQHISSRRKRYDATVNGVKEKFAADGEGS